MKSIYLPLLVILIQAIVKSEGSQCEVADVCVTDLSQTECGAGMLLTPNVNIFGCCPGCVIIGGGNENNDTNVTPIGECRPPSNCLPDGSYAAVQCKGDLFTGRCFCSDAQGNRIFGQMWRKEADDMTCVIQAAATAVNCNLTADVALGSKILNKMADACSRKRSELERSQNKISTLHCAANGDYEPLQCDEGLCWCAQARTGQPTVPPVPEVNMAMLPCYSAAAVGEIYLRRCESIVYALSTINREQAEHGTHFLGNPITFCDYDGSYGPYQIQNGIAYCTGRDGKILGSWQVVSSEMAGMNCNCARDTMIYMPERGMTVTEVCTPNGNYRHLQQAGDVVYCVDSDGYHMHQDDWPEECMRAIRNT